MRDLESVKYAAIQVAFAQCVIYAVAGAVVMLEAMRSTSQWTYNVSELLGLVIVVVLYKYTERLDVRMWLLNRYQYFLPLMWLVIIGITIGSYWLLEWRFFFITVLWSNLTEVKGSVLSTVENQLMSGEELTVFNIRIGRGIRAGQLLGMAGVVTYNTLVGPVDLVVGLGATAVAATLGIWIDMVWCRFYLANLSEGRVGAPVASEI